jgi:hypothetical protein
MELYLGIGVFVALFVTWVVVPPIIKRRHAMAEIVAEDEIED